MKPICIVNGCDNPNCSQGMCFKHYRRWQRYGSTELPPKPTICTIDGCGKKIRAKGYCDYHYGRWITTGSPAAPAPRPERCTEHGCARPVVGWGLCDTHYRVFRRQTTDQRCSVDGCNEPVRARTWCELHYKRWRDQGSELWQPPIKTPPMPKIPRRTIRTYESLHVRLRRWRGPARAHLCIDCGNQADEWAYDHQDPDEVRDPKRDLPYSMKYMEHYQPRCRPCHRLLDGNIYPRQNAG